LLVSNVSGPFSTKRAEGTSACSGLAVSGFFVKLGRGAAEAAPTSRSHPVRGGMFIARDRNNILHSLRSAMSFLAAAQVNDLLLRKFEIEFKEEYVFDFYD